MGVQQTMLAVFSAFAVSAAAAATASASSEKEVTYGGRKSSNTFVQVGKKMNVTTHLVKSPRSLWVIGRLTFLTKETLVEVNPAGILIMARPYGRPKTFAWSSSSSSSIAGRHRALLFHDARRRLSVFLCRSRKAVKIVSETSEFLVDVREEKGVDGRRSESFGFLGVRLARVSIASVDAAVGSLTTVAPSTPSATFEPATRAPAPRRPYTYTQELVIFFKNIERLLSTGANYVKKTAANSYIGSFVELYRPR